MEALKLRLDAREGRLTGPTTGLASNHVQANLIVLPSILAEDFELLCTRNPVCCPLLGKSAKPGNPHRFMPEELFTPSADGCHTLDIRTDTPKYNIYEKGKLVECKHDIMADWKEDSVAFLIGCSFSFEDALIREGFTPRQILMGCNVPMYITNLKLNPAGIFQNAKQVVSMRPYTLDDVEAVRKITRPFVKTHGEPVAWGWEAIKDLGISDITKPEYGDAVEIHNGEVPVFWGCGITPQIAVMSAGRKIPGKVMSHSPGHMLILDMTEEMLLSSCRL